MADAKILLIDDSLTVSDMVVQTLCEAGLRVDAANTFEEGLDRILQTEPHLVLVDEDIGGLRWDRFVSTNGQPAPKLIVLRSNWGDQLPELPALDILIGAIQKPFTSDDLQKAVQDALEQPIRPQPRRLHLTPAPGVAVSDVPSDGALNGTLRLFPVADIMRLLGETRATGTLTVGRARTRIKFSLDHGRLRGAEPEHMDRFFLFGRFLEESGAMSQDELDAIVAHENEKLPDKRRRLGEALIDRGLVSRSTIENALRMQTTALLFECMRWKDGQFSFAESIEPSEGLISLNVETVLLEGLREIREWSVIESHIDDMDIVYVRDDLALAKLGAQTLLQNEIVILDLVNGRRSVRDVISESKIGTFEASRILYRLVRTKLIRAIVPAATAT